jgi:hypothetical protein
LGEFCYDPDHDTKDGELWSEIDIDNLKYWLRDGGPLEEAASYLCRAGSFDDVEKKAVELGLAYTRVYFSRRSGWGIANSSTVDEK